MKHRGWDLRLDRYFDCNLVELRTGRKARIIRDNEDFWCFPENIPWPIINWALRKSVQAELKQGGEYE